MKNFLSRSLKYFGIALFFLLCFELSLFWYVSCFGYKQLKPLPQPQNADMYLLGDSTMQGVGASSPEFSMAGQLESIFKSKGKPIHIQNLAWPGFDIQDQIAMLRRIPSGSPVLLRSRVENPLDLFREYASFHIFGYNYEVQLIRLLGMLIPPEVSLLQISQNDEKKVAEILREIVSSNHINLIFLDYSFFDPSTMIPSLARYTSRPCIQLFPKLRELGYTKEGMLKPHLRSDRVHPNDSGYLLEAQIVFNNLCKLGTFKLNKSDQIPVGVSLKKIYQAQKSRFLKLQAKFLNHSPYEIEQEELNEFMLLAEQLSAIDSKDNIYKKSKYSAEKLLSFLWFQENTISDYFQNLAQELGNNDIREFSIRNNFEFQSYLSLLYAFVSKEERARLLEPLSFLNPQRSDYTGLSLYQSLNTPTSLEQCPAFFKTAKLPPESFSVEEEITFIFGHSYSFKPQEICKSEE